MKGKKGASSGQAGGKDRGQEPRQGRGQGPKLSVGQERAKEQGQARSRSRGQESVRGRGPAHGQGGSSHGGASVRVGSAASAVDFPVEKNEEYQADIIGIGHEGEGVGRVNGFTLFVPGALPGEKVRVKVVKVKKQFGYGKLLSVVEASPDRVDAPCRIYAQCGGCQLQHLSYEAQLRAKRQMVVDRLERIGKLVVADAGASSEGDFAGKGSDNAQGTQAPSTVHPPIVVHPTIGMSDPWRYRNKAQVPFGEERGGLVGGFYAQGSHRIIDMDTCLIQHEQNDTVVAQVKAIARKLGITAYNEETHSGLLRHVVVKVAFRTGEVMVVLVTNGERVPKLAQWIEEIRAAVPAVASICHNVNVKRTNVIFGDETRVLWGAEAIHDYIGDVKFAISARSFYQVNPVQTEVLYRKALEYAGLSGGEVVIDAYCGIGTISLFLAQHAGQVHGIEIVPEAISDARKNAELNGIRNVAFTVGKAEEVVPAIVERGGVSVDVVVVDPPRKGCEESLLEAILALRPRRVVYVSCDPATLARDLRFLVDGGYRVVEVQPVDMFPHTVHVECISSLILEK